MNKAIIHDIAVKRLAIQEEISALNDDLKIEKKKLMEIDAELLKEMSEAQQTLTRVEGYTITVTSQDLYSPTDWSEFETYCENNNTAYLFQRRLSQKAVEERLTLDDSVPVEKFTKKGISIRKVPGAVK